MITASSLRGIKLTAVKILERRKEISFPNRHRKNRGKREERHKDEQKQGRL